MPLIFDVANCVELWAQCAANPTIVLLGDMTCAYFNTEQQCIAETGFGSPSGHCVWRSSTSSTRTTSMMSPGGSRKSDRKPTDFNTDNLHRPPTVSYETCSSSLESCPNYHCDELEMAIPQLCPQDCTGKALRFSYAIRLITHWGRG